MYKIFISLLFIYLALLFFLQGDEHYNIISALHKSIRGSSESAALYWLARMLEGGEDPRYIARRLIRIASEDIGMNWILLFFKYTFKCFIFSMYDDFSTKLAWIWISVFLKVHILIDICMPFSDRYSWFSGNFFLPKKLNRIHLTYLNYPCSLLGEHRAANRIHSLTKYVDIHVHVACACILNAKVKYIWLVEFYFVTRLYNVLCRCIIIKLSVNGYNCSLIVYNIEVN